MYVHHPRRHLDGDALPMEPIRTGPTDLHGRCGGDRQLDVTAKRVQRPLQLVAGGRRMLVERLALRVAGRRPQP